MTKKLAGVVLGGALVLGVLVVAKGASGARAAMTPEGRACTKLADLCPSKEPKKSLESCVEDWNDMRKVAGAPAVDRSIACIDEATTCTAAAGCIAGGVGVGTLGEMMKGFGSALSR